MTSKEKLIERLNLKEEEFQPVKASDKDRLEALEAVMLEILIGGVSDD